MLSFKKPAPTPIATTPDLQATLRRCVGLLLEGIGLHALSIPAVDRQPFLDRMRSSSKEISWAASEREMLAFTGEAIKAVGLYNQQLEQHLAEKRTEVRAIITFLVSTIKETCNFNEQLVGALDELEASFTEEESTDGLKAMKVRLEQTIEEARNSDAETHRELQEFGTADSAKEMVTGLPNRSMAKRALMPGGDRRGIYAVPCRLNSASMITSRYGSDAGKQYLLAASKVLGSAFREEDQLFYWSETALLAIIRRREPEDVVRRDISRLASTNRNHTLQVGERFVMCGIPVSAAVIPFAANPDPKILAERIDSFAVHGTLDGTS